MQYCRGGKKSKRFSPGSDFTEQIFTGELSEVDLAGVLRQDVSLIENENSVQEFHIKGTKKFCYTEQILVIKGKGVGV